MAAKRIQLLEPRLANQIAAGEVIERPASVIKELIENSLDANAKRIEVDVVQGGLQLIRIRDDGQGIHPDDLPLAVSRHATSKVASLADLENLQSLGFRGEALASICSVSRFCLTSRIAGEENGWQVRVEGRDMVPTLAPAPHPIGTTVEVADLFFNTPARRKFLRSDKTEWNHILELIKRIALSRFDVSFYLNHQQKNILQLRAADTEQGQLRRLHDICGAGFARHNIPLLFTAHHMRLSGWIGIPQEAPTLPNPQYFYINGRIVRDKLVLHAIKQAYEGLLAEGRHPVYVLYLEIEPAMVDVNVHPTKHEVRFRESRLVHDFIFSSIRRLIAEAQQQPASYTEIASVKPPANVAEQMALYKQLHGIPGCSPQAPAALLPEKHSFGNIIGQLHGRYLLLQQPERLGIIDLSQAYEAVIFNSLEQALQQPNQPIHAQPLLIPATSSASAEVIHLIEKHQALFAQCGLDLAVLGSQKIILRALPSIIREADAARVLEGILQLLNDKTHPITSRTVFKTLAKNFFFPDKILRPNEFNELLLKLEADPALIAKSYTVLTLTEIDKLFNGVKGCN